MVVLGPCGWRRWAALAAAIPVAYYCFAYVRRGFAGHDPLNLLAIPFVFIAPIAEIVALLASPGPHRGRKLLHRRHWAVLAAAAVGGAAMTANYTLITMFRHVGAVRVMTLAAAMLILVLLLATWLSSGTGKRLAVLFALVACPHLLTAALTPGS